MTPLRRRNSLVLTLLAHRPGTSPTVLPLTQQGTAEFATYLLSALEQEREPERDVLHTNWSLHCGSCMKDSMFTSRDTIHSLPLTTLTSIQAMLADYWITPPEYTPCTNPDCLGSEAVNYDGALSVTGEFLWLEIARSYWDPTTHTLKKTANT